MEQLNGVDAGYLSMETPVQQAHIGDVVIVDPATAKGDWGFETIQTLIEERIHLLPQFRRRLVTVPFELDHPYWVECPSFDLAFHMRRIAVPPPGDAETLSELIARIHARPLDRTRPLWELYMIEGLDSGQVAMYTKVHHAAVDGVTGAEIMTILLDSTPDASTGARDTADATAAGSRMPSQVELLARSALSAAVRPAKAMRLGYELLRSLPALRPLRSLPSLVGLGRPGADDVIHRPSLMAPHTRLNQPITAHRRWAFGTVPLEDARAVKAAFGVTVNDVVVAATGGALRRWLLRHGELPARSLQALTPLSVRGDSLPEGADDLSAIITVIGTDIDDPIERLEVVHQTTRLAKETHQATPAALLRDIAEFAPPAVAARAARLVFRNGRAGRVTPFSLVLANVPGPDTPLYLAGAELTGHYPVQAIIDGAALNVTIHSYRGELCFGLVADRDLVPDLWAVMDFIKDEIAAMKDRAGR